MHVGHDRAAELAEDLQASSLFVAADNMATATTGDDIMS